MNNAERTRYLDKEAILIISVFGLLFGLGTMFSEGARLDLFAIGCSFGAYCGFAGLPYIDKNKWHPKPITCSILAALGALIFANFRELAPEHVSGLVIGGLFAGYFAPYWVRYM